MYNPVWAVFRQDALDRKSKMYCCDAGRVLIHNILLRMGYPADGLMEDIPDFSDPDTFSTIVSAL